MTKKILLLLLLLNGFLAFSQSPCSGGLAAGTYPCNGITLQAYISAANMDAAEAQDSWGWTDPLDGKEYAVVALDNGTSFVDISDPINPRYLGRLDSHSGGSNLWRDVKVYSNHAYIVSEVNDDGLQIFDLTGLRGLSTSPFGAASRNFSEDGFLFIGDSGGGGNDGRAHNIVINEDAGFAYI
ncbi:MAG: choice-of-anchor B family protein, partial [Flavobacteriaceae bacterium]|nr:choice-of-anchor B family protein [Flavobacteriaceae bacterium]